MKKNHMAFLMSAERLAEMGRLYFWTFTLPVKMDITDTRKRWNHMLTLLRKQWPRMCGLRVFEMHDSHGLHVHLLTNRFIDVNTARSLASRAGWGRIHVKRYPASRVGYLGKYLSKERPPCFKGWRLWAGFGKDWKWTKVGDLEKNSSVSRVYRYFRDQYGWIGKKGFFNRMEKVNRALERQIRISVKVKIGPKDLEVRESIKAGSVLFV